MRRDLRQDAWWKYGKAEQDQDGLLVEVSENEIQICRHFSGGHCCQSVSFLTEKKDNNSQRLRECYNPTLRRSVLRFWVGVPLRENAEKANRRDFLRASKLQSRSDGSLDNYCYGRLMATKEFVTHLISFGLESFDWSTKECWYIKRSANLLKLECERIRSQRARFCPGNLGGIPSMWTWAGRRLKGQPRNLRFHRKSKEQPRNQRLADLHSHFWP